MTAESALALDDVPTFLLVLDHHIVHRRNTPAVSIGVDDAGRRVWWHADRERSSSNARFCRRPPSAGRTTLLIDRKASDALVDRGTSPSAEAIAISGDVELVWSVLKPLFIPRHDGITIRCGGATW